MNIIEKFENYLEKGWVKRLLVSALIGVTAVSCAEKYSADIHEDIVSNIVRLHVIANSDSDYDQQLKLKVRDSVTQYLSEKLRNTDQTEAAKEVINQSLEEISAVAQSTIEENGYSYETEAVTGAFDFPTKSYGKTTLPAGKYYALRVIIGEGKGKNWWCVLYPGLCLGSLDKSDLKTALKAETYAVVTENDSPKYRFRFKILELFKK